jgi:negative regulator of flagellin synthesis FlgM
MQIHGLAHVHGAQSINGPHRTQGAGPAQQTDAWTNVDELDISQEADLVSRARDVADVRADRVAEIKADIAAGVYETDEKLEIALGRLLDEMSG